MVLTFFVLDLCLDILDAVRGLNLQSNGFASEGLDKDLHSTTETQDQVKGRLLLDVIIGESAAIFKLFASKNQPLLIGGNSCQQRRRGQLESKELVSFKT